MNTSQFSISRNVFLNSEGFFGVFNGLGRDGLPLHITVCFLKGKNLLLSIYFLQSCLQWNICRMQHLMKVAIWQRSVMWPQGFLPQLFFGQLVTPLKETLWLSPTSQEVSVANIDALQTTLVEGCLRRCSLMYSVRIYAIHLFLLFAFNRLCYSYVYHTRSLFFTSQFA